MKFPKLILKTSVVGSTCVSPKSELIEKGEDSDGIYISKKYPDLILKGGRLDMSKLHKKVITDKTGKKTTKWVRGNEEMKAPRTKNNQKPDKRAKAYKAMVQEVQPLIDTHEETFNQTLDEMKKEFPKANVYGRVKEVASAADKVFIRSKNDEKYQSSSMTDLTGFRVETGSIKDVNKNVAKLKEMYEVVEEKDYISHPKGVGYRRYHVICKDDTGKVFEVQLGTPNQTKFADWFHDIYKPRTKEQASLVRENITLLEDYAKQHAEIYFKMDSGKEVKMEEKPPCTHEIKETFGCLD